MKVQFQVSWEPLCAQEPQPESHFLWRGARVQSALPPPRWPRGAPHCTWHDWSTFLILEFASTSLKHPSRFACSLLRSVPCSAGPHPAALSATREDSWACFYHLLCLQPSVPQSCHAGVDRDPHYPWGHQDQLSQPRLQRFSNFKRHLSHLWILLKCRFSSGSPRRGQRFCVLLFTCCSLWHWSAQPLHPREAPCSVWLGSVAIAFFVDCCQLAAIYWVDQKVLLSFSITSYEKT